MMKILSISCIVLCTIVIIYVVSIYLESRQFLNAQKNKNKKHPY